jgi:hypothetical protein
MRIYRCGTLESHTFHNETSGAVGTISHGSTTPSLPTVRNDASIWRLLGWITIGVNLADLTDVQFADTKFDFAHIADNHPDEMVGQDVLLGDFVAVAGVIANTFLVYAL